MLYANSPLISLIISSIFEILSTEICSTSRVLGLLSPKISSRFVKELKFQYSKNSLNSFENGKLYSQSLKLNSISQSVLIVASFLER